MQAIRLMGTALVQRASGQQLATLEARRRAIAAHSGRVVQGYLEGPGGPSQGGGGGAGGGGIFTCSGSCLGGASTAGAGGTLYNVFHAAPTAGTYYVSGYTVDKYGNQTPISFPPVTIANGQEGPNAEINSSVVIKPSVDMTNGLFITVMGPGGNDDAFSALCDSGTAGWNWPPD
jgi:hypothetical protein